MNNIGSYIIFTGLSLMTIVSALIVISDRNLFRSTIALGGHLLAISGFYFLLQADLIAMMQVFVYVGGVIVVLLFAVMMTSQITNIRLVSGFDQKMSVITAVIILIALQIYAVTVTAFKVSGDNPIINTASYVGKMYLTDYILPFEVISILLLAAVIGALVISRGETKHDPD